MAITYSDLFGDVGELIKSINQFRNVATGSGAPVPDLPTLISGVETQFNSTGRHDVLSGLPEIYDGFKDSAIGWADQLVGKIIERLSHNVTVLEQLPGLGGGASVEAILRELYRDMVANAESINQSSVTIGAVSADGSNTGDGTVLTDKVLDGVSEPRGGFAPNLEYVGSDSELSVVDEDMRLTCTADEDTDGLPSGEEVFLWETKVPPLPSPLDWNTEGSGTITSVATLNSQQIISNKDFESWSANVPEGWDLDLGVAGTNVIQETTAADVFRGDSALRFVGDGATATLQISQTLPTRILIPQQRYCLSCQVKSSGVGVLAGALTIEFESPSGGYTASGTEKISMNTAALVAQTTYGEEHFYFTIPQEIPDDMELVIKITGTLTNAEKVWIDSLAFGPVDYANGVSIAIVAGATQFVRNDRLTFNVANDDAGVFQTFFRKQFRMQLPSSGAPTIGDALAT